MTVYEMLEISERSSQEELDSAYQKEMRFLENFPASTPDETALISRKMEMLRQAYEQRNCLQSEEPDTSKSAGKRKPWYMPEPNVLYGCHIPCVFYGCFSCIDAGCNNQKDNGCVAECYDGEVTKYMSYGRQYTREGCPCACLFRLADTAMVIGTVIAIIRCFFPDIRRWIQEVQNQRAARKEAREYAAYLQKVDALNERLEAIQPYETNIAPLLNLITSLPGDETTVECDRKISTAQENVFEMKNREVKSFCEARALLRASPYYNQLRQEHPEYNALFTAFQGGFSDTMQW